MRKGVVEATTSLERFGTEPAFQVLLVCCGANMWDFTTKNDGFWQDIYRGIDGDIESEKTMNSGNSKSYYPLTIKGLDREA